MAPGTAMSHTSRLHGFRDRSCFVSHCQQSPTGATSNLAAHVILWKAQDGALIIGPLVSTRLISSYKSNMTCGQTGWPSNCSYSDGYRMDPSKLGLCPPWQMQPILGISDKLRGNLDWTTADVGRWMHSGTGFCPMVGAWGSCSVSTFAVFAACNSCLRQAGLLPFQAALKKGVASENVL